MSSPRLRMRGMRLSRNAPRWRQLLQATLLAVPPYTSSAVSAQQAPVRAVLAGPATEEAEALARKVVGKVMSNAGLVFTLTVEPAARAQQSWTQGRYDVDIARYESFDQVAPGSHIVRPHLFTYRLVALGLKALATGPNGAVLKPERAAFLRGGPAVEEWLQGVHQTIAVASREACIGMAARGRVDACVLIRGPSLTVPDVPDGVRLVESPITRQHLFMWTAPEQAALAPRLSKAVQGMLQSGELKHLTGADRDP